MSLDTAIEERLRSCLQTKFYGLYQILSFKIRKMQLGYSLEHLILRGHEDTCALLRSIAANCDIATLLLRECVERICMCRGEPRQEQKMHVVVSAS